MRGLAAFVLAAVLTLAGSLSLAAMPMSKGPALQPGATIGIVAPATHSEGIDLAPGIQALQHLGYRVQLAPHALAQTGYFAGTDADRARDVNDFFRDDRIQAILCLNGGYGSARILDKLDYAMIAAHPKMLIGFSDITALQAALYEKSHLVTVSGPLLVTLHDDRSYSEQQLQQGLAATAPIGEVKLPPGRQLTTLVPGEASGRLIGGNLTVVASLAGTPYELKGDGAILVLEDVGEDAYRLDRILNQLWQNGLLQRVEAIVYGDFIDCPHDPGDFTADQVLAYYAKLAGKPAVRGLPVGHGPDKAFLPLGVEATLYAPEGAPARLVIRESHTAGTR